MRESFRKASFGTGDRMLIGFLTLDSGFMHMRNRHHADTDAWGQAQDQALGFGYMNTDGGLR
jgi:hypothetical protein